MPPLLRPLWICALLMPAVGSAEPVPGMPQLMQLNRASEQELQRLQQEAAPPPDGAASADRRQARERTYRQQRLQQQWLQERQRRELLMWDQRSRMTGVPDGQRRLDAIQRQRAFQWEQRQQLNRFTGPRGPLAR